MWWTCPRPAGPPLLGPSHSVSSCSPNPADGHSSSSAGTEEQKQQKTQPFLHIWSIVALTLDKLQTWTTVFFTLMSFSSMLWRSCRGSMKACLMLTSSSSLATATWCRVSPTSDRAPPGPPGDQSERDEGRRKDKVEDQPEGNPEDQPEEDEKDKPEYQPEDGPGDQQLVQPVERRWTSHRNKQKKHQETKKGGAGGCKGPNRKQTNPRGNQKTNQWTNQKKKKQSKTKDRYKWAKKKHQAS